MQKKGLFFNKIEHDYVALQVMAGLGTLGILAWLSKLGASGLVALVPVTLLLIVLVSLNNRITLFGALRELDSFVEKQLPALEVMRGLYRYRMGSSVIVMWFEDNKGNSRKNIIASRLFLCRTHRGSWFILNLSIVQRGMLKKHLIRWELQPITEERAKVEVINYAMRENMDLAAFSKYFDSLEIKDA